MHSERRTRHLVRTTSRQFAGRRGIRFICSEKERMLAETRKRRQSYPPREGLFFIIFFFFFVWNSRTCVSRERHEGMNFTNVPTTRLAHLRPEKSARKTRHDTRRATSLEDFSLEINSVKSRELNLDEGRVKPKLDERILVVKTSLPTCSHVNTKRFLPIVHLAMIATRSL